MLIDLTAAYDTVWKRGLLYKLIKSIPCLKTCDLICNMLSDRVFKVLLNDQRSRFKKLNNGLPQGSVLACLLFNLYIHDLPPSLSRKFLYADDKAYAYQNRSFVAINKALNKDLIPFARFCKQWRLVPSASKTVVTCFHLRNRGADLELRVLLDGAALRHEFEPTYLGVKLDRSLTYGKHIEKLKSKLCTRNNLIQKLAGTSWGATAACLRTSALCLLYSTAEYCCSTWLNSAHTYKVDVELNKAMRVITGTVKSTPLAWLPALSNIAPPDIRRQNALLRLYRKVSCNQNIPLYNDLQVTIPSRLKSRNPSIALAKDLHANGFDGWEAWKTAWLNNGVNSLLFNFDAHSSGSEEFKLPRKIWCNLNRLRTEHGNCNELLHKWKFIENPSCSCGHPNQTMAHLLLDCPIFKFQGAIGDIVDLTSQAKQWLAGLNL